METLKNAADVLLGHTTPTKQSGKEPETTGAVGSGGPEPFDPGNKEENEQPVLESAATATSPTTATAPADHATAEKTEAEKVKDSSAATNGAGKLIISA